eukprot:TRINITY_DN1633_c0_g1_i2.p1 TRINITY_DN1633_c0_g1~~TRINITY_DN1633_c0_g1_i2.p1  ORF type:complete len:357 (+),score=120.39 TRINITY_DN1633_c0_g1_i2:705-1775(+)
MHSEKKMISIEKQESLASDSFTKNGVKKQLHIVAKAVPFVLHLASNSFLLHSATISTRLFYDNETKETEEAGTQETASKEVEVLRSVQPMESVSHVSKDGRRASVEVKLNILSSQHEGAHFKVLVSVIDPNTKQTHQVFSHPVRVISKRNQAKKIVSKATSSVSKSVTGDSASSSMEPKASSTSERREPIKRSAIDLLAESMVRIERQQQDQSKVLNLLMRKQFAQNGKNEEGENPFQFNSPFGPNMDFESCFRNFLESWNSVHETERPNKLRRVIQSSTSNEMESLNNFMGHLANVGSDVDPLGAYSHHVNNYDDFESDIYSDMLSSPQHEVTFSAYQDNQTVEGDFLDVEIQNQ